MGSNPNQCKILVCVDGPMDGAVCSMRTKHPTDQVVFVEPISDIDKEPVTHTYIIEDGCLLRYSHSSDGTKRVG